MHHAQEEARHLGGQPPPPAQGVEGGEIGADLAQCARDLGIFRPEQRNLVTVVFEHGFSLAPTA